MEAADAGGGGDAPPRKGRGRCLPFFWLGAAFNAVGAAVLLLGVFAAEPYGDLLLYLGSCCFFLSLLWWVCWYSGNVELGPEDGAGSKPFPLGLCFVGLADAPGQPLAFRQTSTPRGCATLSGTSALLRDSQRLLPTQRPALLSQATKGRLEKARSGPHRPQGRRPGEDARDSDHGSGRRRTDRLPSPEAGSGQHRGADSWRTKCPCTDPGKVTVQPLSPTLLASQKRLPLLLPLRSRGSASMGQPPDAAREVPGLPPGSAWPRRPLCVMTAISTPSLSESVSSCPPRVLPSRSHPSLWHAFPPQSPSLLDAQRYLQRLSHFQHPSRARPAGPTSLQSHLQTTSFYPPPPASPTAGIHLASLIHPSSKDSSFIHKIALNPKAPAQHSQRPGSLGPRTLSPEGREPSVSHPCSVAKPEESPGLQAWGPKVSI